MNSPIEFMFQMGARHHVGDDHGWWSTQSPTHTGDPGELTQALDDDDVVEGAFLKEVNHRLFVGQVDEGLVDDHALSRVGFCVGIDLALGIVVPVGLLGLTTTRPSRPSPSGRAPSE